MNRNWKLKNLKLAFDEDLTSKYFKKEDLFNKSKTR